MQKIWHRYLRPKPIEYYRSGTIYDLIGIRIYKKYLPSSGDLVRKWRNIRQITPSNGNLFQQLYQRERETRKYEFRHWIGAVVFVLLTLLLDRKLTLTDWIFLPLLNMYINIYPIFLQRYNRIRIIKVLHKNGRLGPYDTIVFK